MIVENAGADILLKDPRTRKLKRVLFQPYFYIEKSENSDIFDTKSVIKKSTGKEAEVYKEPSIVRVVEDGCRNLEGIELKKIIVRSPSDVPQLRRNFDECYEDDVIYTKRWCIDAQPNFSEHVTRILYYDIETDGFSDPVDAAVPIICIGTYNTKNNQYVQFMIDKERNGRVERKGDDKSVIYFESERDLLLHFIKFVQNVDPDIITAWNGSRFDDPYLIKRIERYTNPDYLAWKDLMTVVKGRKVFVDHGFRGDLRTVCKGRILFDMLKGYKRLYPEEMESYGLDNVGRVELGLGKLSLDEAISDIDKMSEYNFRDVEILVKLDEKVGIIDFHRSLQNIISCPFNMLNNSDLIDILIMREMKKRGIVLPGSTRMTSGAKYGGGAVMKPVKGLHEWVSVLDISGMYPNIMRTFNISPETKVRKGRQEDANNNIISLPNNVKFYASPEGVVPKILRSLKEQRLEVKDRMKKIPNVLSEEYKVLDRKQYTIKVIMNSIYGVMGFRASRLFDIDLASSVTFMGREIIYHLINKVESETDFLVLYSDTDSIFIKTGGKDVLENVERSREIVKVINKELQEYPLQFGCTKSYFEIEFDIIFRRLLLGDAKKRYAGRVVWKE